RLPYEDGKQIEIGDVLLISDADRSFVGAPLIENAKVLATVEGPTRGEKLIVFKYKSKKRYRHRRGHRQELTVLTIDDIVADGKSLITGMPPVAKEEPVEEEEEATPVTTETDENETPVSEAAETDTEQRTTRRRRTANVEDTESKAEEE